MNARLDSQLPSPSGWNAGYHQTTSGRAERQAPIRALYSPPRFRSASAAASGAELSEREFSESLVTLLPELRRRALQLTRHPERAEDLVQDTVERALRFRHTFVAGSRLRAWLMRILTNTFVSERRRAATERRVLEGSGHDPNGWVRSCTTRLMPGLCPPVERALRELPERLGSTVELVDLEEHSYREAAELLNVPVGTVMSRLHRGRARLAARLSEPVA